MKYNKRIYKKQNRVEATEFISYTDAIYFLENNCLDYSATELYYSDDPDVRGALNKLWEVKNRYSSLREQNRQLKQEIWKLTHPDNEDNNIYDDKKDP